MKLSVYIFAGLTAGIAALLSLGYYGGATSGDGQGYELNVIAAAVVGGASLSGGKGSALGALLGALVIQMISSGIVILGIDQNYSQIIIGAVVIMAVVLDQFNNWLAKRQLTKAGVNICIRMESRIAIVTETYYRPMHENISRSKIDESLDHWLEREAKKLGRTKIGNRVEKPWPS